MSRSIFEYVPGRWTEFDAAVREAGEMHGAPIKRTMLIFTSLGWHLHDGKILGLAGTGSQL